jgi:DNA-binding GntR family transcriptional regulator
MFDFLYSLKGIEYLEEHIESFLTGNNLANEKIRKVYSALADDPIQQQSFWGEFAESAKRRNLVSHKGRIVKEVEARRSVAAAEALIDHLEKRRSMLSNGSRCANER